VNFSVSENPDPTSRVGTLTIAGRTFTVTQAAGCRFTLKSGSLTVPTQGLVAALSVDTTAGCSWSASNMPAWVSIPSGVQTGPGTLSYTVAANLGVARTATLTIAGQPLVINQSAAAVLPPANVRIIRAPEQ
jgi:Putative binding domain, N-terminal